MSMKYIFPANYIMNEYIFDALSDKEVLKLVDGRASVVLYNQLQHCNNIDQVLGKYECCFLFFDSGKKIGHWCSLFKRGKIIEFFNSYGGFPDDTISNDIFSKVDGQSYPYLTRLLYHSNLPIEYNQYVFQGSDKRISTCGRHAAVRLIFRDFTIDQYKDMIQQFCKIYNTDSDRLITAITLALNNMEF